MKLKYAVLPAAVAMLFSAAASAADTVDDQGRIYFLGSVKAPTCVVNGGQRNLTECTGQWANLRLEATDRYNDSMIKFAETSNSAKGLALGLKAVDDATAPFIKVNGKETNWRPIQEKVATYKFYPYIYQLADIVQSGKLRAQVLYTIKYV